MGLSFELFLKENDGVFFASTFCNGFFNITCPKWKIQKKCVYQFDR